MTSLARRLPSREMLDAAAVLLAILFPFSLAADPADPLLLTNHSVEDVRRIYEDVLQRNKAHLKSAGRQVQSASHTG